MSSPQKNSVQIRHLLWLYAVVPVALIAAAANMMTDGALASSLPDIPDHWWWWFYIFGMPHAFASFLVFADQDYVSHYGTRLWIGAAACLILPFVLMSHFGSAGVFLVFTAMIVYHVIAQQFGIALIIDRRRPDAVHRIGKWSTAISGIVLYAYAYNPPFMDIYLAILRPVLWPAALTLLAIGLASLVYQTFRTENTTARVFYGANIALIGASFACYFAGLGIASLIIGRIVHEWSAWLIYAVHDENRNATTTNNLLYRAKYWGNVPDRYKGILMAYALGIPLTWGANNLGQQALLLLVIGISLYHYWVEGIIWRGASPAKRHVAFS